MMLLNKIQSIRCGTYLGLDLRGNLYMKLNRETENNTHI